MMLDKDNFYFLPPNNKNGLSVRPPNDLYLSDRFEFRVTFSLDTKKSENKNCGIIMLNGKHLGISVQENYIFASIWTNKGHFQTSLPLDNKLVTCTFICDNKNKQITIKADEKTSSIDFKGNLVDDYKYSYLWIGCGNGFKDSDDEFRNSFFGDISYLKIRRDGNTIFKSHFKKKTEFKVFDESNSGNHLLIFSILSI